jgi:hypothetical protein
MVNTVVGFLFNLLAKRFDLGFEVKLNLFVFPFFQAGFFRLGPGFLKIVDHPRLSRILSERGRTGFL